MHGKLSRIGLIFKAFFPVLQVAPLVTAFVLVCNNPFFPPTGNPPVVKGPRSTPQGVMQQLKIAYENRRIDLYMDLFSTAHDFRFYVSPVYAADPSPTGYKARFGNPCETVDTMCHYIKQNINDSCFNFWRYDEEIQSAQGLFQKSTHITFQTSPNLVDSIRYIVNGRNETTNVEAIMPSGGTIIIDGIPDYSDSTQPFAYQYPIDIGKQVFYLERDPETPGLWVIQKWFDLGEATGN